jgi:hypothetical protein
MPDFDELKDDAEKYAQEHPEQVQKGEQAAEEKLGIQPQGGDQQGGDQQDQGGDDSGNQGR